ncbi:MAG TPA: alpha/beta hydrolase [Planctomycetota bacterium]|nr:alpha/beta hydrolase [Planctomycetota bacterium]
MGGARGAVRILALVAGAYVLVVALVYLFQRKLQYFPAPEAPPLPKGAEDVRLEAADGTALRAWHWPGACTVLVLHGNAGHRGYRLHIAQGLVAKGYGVFLLDYRGYGGSAGSPTEEGLLLDSEASVRWLREHGTRRIAYYGESLGCGVAALLAAKEPPAAIVFQSGADSLARVGRKVYPWLPIGLLMKDRYEAAEAMRGVRCPVLSVHGDADELIPWERGRALFDAAASPKEWWLVEGAGHNDVIDVAGPAFFDRVATLLSGK